MRNEFFQILGQQGTVFVSLKDFKNGLLAGAHHLPGDDVGMMLGNGNYDLVPPLDKGLAKREGNQVYGGGCSGGKHYLFPVFGTQKSRDGIPGVFIFRRSVRGKFMDRPVDIGIAGPHKLFPFTNHGFRPLGRGSVVQIYQRLSVHLCGQNRKLISCLFYRHNVG